MWWSRCNYVCHRSKNNPKNITRLFFCCCAKHLMVVPAVRLAWTRSRAFLATTSGLMRSTRKIFVVFRSRWLRVYARMKMLAMKALQRSMSSLSVNVVQDVVGMRWWFPKIPFSLDEEQMKENQQRHDGAVAASWWMMWFLGQIMRKLKKEKTN